jgi:DNA-directed RNA polymerase specialized sigma24 family protein
MEPKTDTHEDMTEREYRPLALAPDNPDLRTLSDVGLVHQMAAQDRAQESAFAACEELHRRHARLLHTWCLTNHAETFLESAEDFVNLTFCRALKAAPTFSCPISLTAEASRQVVRAWLFRILKNQFYDARKSERREPVERTEAEEDTTLTDTVQQDTEESCLVPSLRLSLVHRFLADQELVDRSILNATAEFWCPSAKQTIIPAHVRKAICHEHGLSEISLRVRRKRLLAALKQFIIINETPNDQPAKTPSS